jgi:uncharacterized protein (TIGR02300 family)
MPAKDLGTKHTCFKCQTKFYDLKKSEPICPKCGADQRHSPVNKPPPAEKRTRAPAKPIPAVVAVDEAEPEAELDEEPEDEDEDEEDGEDEP